MPDAKPVAPRPATLGHPAIPTSPVSVPRPTAPVLEAVMPIALEAQLPRVKKFHGAASGRIPWHGGHDLFVFNDRLVLTKVKRQSYRSRATRKRLEQDSRIAPGVLGTRKGARVMMLNSITDVDIWRKPTGGRATFWLSAGSHVDFDWSNLRNRDRDPEDLLLAVLSDRLDRTEGSTVAFAAGIVVRMTTMIAVLAMVVAAAVGIATVAGRFLDGGEAEAPAAPAPTTLPDNVAAAQAELAKVCPAWTGFAGRSGMGDRPRPADLLPVVDGMRASFDIAAGLNPSLTAARDQLGWLQDYARRTDDLAVREAAARIRLAMGAVDTACAF